MYLGLGAAMGQSCGANILTLGTYLSAGIRTNCSALSRGNCSFLNTNTVEERAAGRTGTDSDNRVGDGFGSNTVSSILLYFRALYCIGPLQ
jgi:hypothetical protein